MKILITTGIFRPELGGPATLAAELPKRLQAAGHTVGVITYSDKAQYDFDTEYTFPLIRVVRTKSKFKNYKNYFFTVLKYGRKYDLIYSLDWFSAGVPVMLAAKVLFKKYVVRVGGGYIWEKYLSQNNPPLTLKEFYKQGLYKKYKSMYFLIKSVLKSATVVIFNSDEQREIYEKYYNLSSARTRTIFNVVPEHKFGLLLQSYNLNNETRDKEIVFAGRFIKMKNVESLIKAFSRLTDPAFKLLLIGEGPTEPELRKLVAECNLSERVTFMKPLSQLELYRRIANCYYVIIPSWTDVSPNQVYECLALDIPFLLTQETYLSINKKEFLKINPASVDDIAEKMNLLLDPEQYNNFTQSLSKLRFKRSWNQVVQEHMDIFNSVIH